MNSLMTKSDLNALLSLVKLALARGIEEVLTPSTKDLFLSAKKSYICNYPLHKIVHKRIFEPAD